MIRYLVAADPISTFQVKYDTSLRLMAEAQSRGIEVDYCDLSKCNTSLSTRDYLSAIPVARVEYADPKRTPFIGLGPARKASVEDYDVILQRKDPPVDEAYIAHSKHFAQAPKRILQINNPDVTYRYSEHILPTRFAKYSIPTEVCESLPAFIGAVRDQKGEAVAKPENQCSGVGIEFFKHDVDEKVLRDYWEKWKPTVVVQPFVEEITKSGDLRILVMNHRVMGSVLRVPRAGSRLANLHQGARGVAFTPTKRQLEACARVADELTPLGIYLIGCDFIGDYLSEINITSPSALVQINEVMNIRAEVALMDQIEKLRKERAGAPAAKKS